MAAKQRTTNEDESGNNKTLGIAVALVLIAALALTIVYSGRSNYIPVTSGVVPAGASGGMSSEGFSSYEEMMQAHHGGSSTSASSGGGCGGVATPSASTAQLSFAGQKAKYGITYDSAGYEQLLQAANMQITPAQTKEIVGLNIQMPCCGVTTMQASGNCGCGHHVALYGLAKLMASEGYTRDQMQVEMDKWKQIFYPDGVDSGAGACG